MPLRLVQAIRDRAKRDQSKEGEHEGKRKKAKMGAADEFAAMNGDSD